MDETLFSDLIARVRQGDERATEQLLKDFESEVRLMVRHRLPRALRSQFDSLDFVQSVWTSLFVNPDQEPVAFTSARHFRGYLAGVVTNKVNEEYRKRTRTQKYDLSRQEPLYTQHDGHEQPRDLPGTGPTPSQEAQATDRMAQLSAGLSPAEAQALELRRRGLTFEEIAEETGLHERTIRKLIERIRGHLEARQWR